MGRLWQTLILSRWRPLFADLAVAHLVRTHQEAYYRAIEQSTAEASATPFLELMLNLIREALDALPADASVAVQASEQVTEQVRRLVDALGDDTCPSRTLMARLGLNHRPSFVKNYLRPALDAGLVDMTDPAHPRSPHQRYRLTAAGQHLAARHTLEP